MPHRAGTALKLGNIALRRQRIAQFHNAAKYQRFMKKVGKADRIQARVLGENVVFRNLRRKVKPAPSFEGAFSPVVSELPRSRDDSPPPGGVLSTVEELGPPPAHSLPSTAPGRYAGTSWAPVVVNENTPPTLTGSSGSAPFAASGNNSTIQLPPVHQDLPGTAPFVRPRREDYLWIRNPPPKMDPPILYPAFIYKEVPKFEDHRGFIRLPPQPISKTVDVFGNSVTRPLSKEDVSRLEEVAVDLDRAIEVWKAMQRRENSRLIAKKIYEDDKVREMDYQLRQIEIKQGYKGEPLSASTSFAKGPGLLSTFFGIHKHNSFHAIELRTKLIKQGVQVMERKLRRSMNSYITAWQAIASRDPTVSVTLPAFRDFPWPIEPGWATAPEELTKDEIKRFFFSKCNLPKASSRADAFRAALTFWERDGFKRRLLRWYPGSTSVSEKILEGAELVYAHLQELEEELEPTQAAQRKRLREEEEEMMNQPPPKKRRILGDVWDKFTGVLQIPTSFNFSAMKA